MTDEALEKWVRQGVQAGFVVQSGHRGWDGITWVPTLVLQTEAVKDLQARGRSNPPQWLPTTQRH